LAAGKAEAVVAAVVDLAVAEAANGIAFKFRPICLASCLHMIAARLCVI